jgi:hypothetical protein
MALITLSGCSAPGGVAPGGAPATPSTTATAAPATTADVCARAQQLLDDGDAEAAVTLIDDYRAPAIERLAADAGRPDDALLSAACDTERTAAFAAAPEPADPSGPSAAVTAWEATQKAWLTPWATLLTWTLGVSAALIVLARLLVFVVPWPSLLPRWRRSEPFTLRLSRWPLVLIVLGVAIAVMGWGFLAGTTAQWPVTLIGTLAAVVGTWRTVHWFGARPRVAVSVTGADGSPSPVRSAQVAQLIRELAATGPRGIDFPGASDVSELADATSKVSENALVGFLTSVAEFVFNVSPWRVSVTEVDGGASLVEIRWNGIPIAAETLNAASVSPSGLKMSDGPKDAAQRLHAAFVATTLVNNYVDMTGLYGATKWRSVGLTFIAVSPFDAAAREKLLERAVQEDPLNALARRGRDNLRHADPDTIEKTDAALGALEREANAVAPLSGDLGPFPAAPNWRRPEPPASPWSRAPRDLLARTLLMWTTALSNRIVLSRVPSVGVAAGLPARVVPAYPGRWGPEADARAVALLVTTVAGLTADAGDAQTPFLGALRGRTAILVERLHDLPAYAPLLSPLRTTTLPWYAEAVASESPAMKYRLACRAAVRGMPFEELLRAAFEDDGYIGWAPKDPDFAAYRDSHWTLLHPDVTSDIWEVAPLSDHRKKLSAMGIRTPAQLARSGRDERRALGLDRPTFAHLRRVARLGARLEATTPQRWRGRVPLLFSALVGAEIDTLARLRAASLDDLEKALADAVRGMPRRRPDPSATSPYVTPRRAARGLRARWLRV